MVARQSGSRALSNLVEFFKGRDVRFHKTESAFVKSRVDHLPPAGRVAVNHRHNRPKGTVETGNVVSQRRGNPRRRPIGITGNLPQPAYGLAHDTVPASSGVGPVLAKPTDAHENDAGVFRRKIIIPQAPALQRSRAKVLDDDIGGQTKLADQSPPFRLTQINRNQALVAEDRGGVERFSRAVRPHRAHSVALGLLDFDHLCTEIGHEPTAERPGDRRPQLDYPQSRERTACMLTFVHVR